MGMTSESPVLLPFDGPCHCHTGCFHVECPLPGGLALWVVGGIPYPRLVAGRLAVRLGQRLIGWVRPAKTATGYDQGGLERSGTLDGLDVEWVDLVWAGGRVFHLWATPELLADLTDRVRAFASRTA